MAREIIIMPSTDLDEFISRDKNDHQRRRLCVGDENPLRPIPKSLVLFIVCFRRTNCRHRDAKVDCRQIVVGTSVDRMIPIQMTYFRNNCTFRIGFRIGSPKLQREILENVTLSIALGETLRTLNTKQTQWSDINLNPFFKEVRT